MRRYAPRSIAFLGKRAFSAMIDQSDVELGRHPTRFAGATAWVLPNPSGFNKAFTLDGLWRLVDGPPRRTVAAGVLIMMAADDTHRDRRAGYAEAPAQPSDLTKRTVDAGYCASCSAGRLIRATNSPPQFGQRPPSVVSTQSRQKIHSKL